MKIIMMISLLSVSIFANEYFAKLQPLNTFNVKAQISGKIEYINEKIKGRIANKSAIIMFNTVVDKIELNQTNNKIKNYEKIIKIEKGTLKKFQKIKSKSQLDKDNQKIKVLNLENQLSDLITKKAILTNKLEKKLLVENNKYISGINVKVGDFVNAGSLLYTAEDLTKAKLVIYLPIDSAKALRLKTIYINGRKTTYKIYKLYDVADTKHISSYKCEIIVNPPADFSKLVKIEFK